MSAVDTILYDGHCRICSAGARKLKRWLPADRVALESFREPGVIEKFGIPAERCEKAMQLVRADGRSFEGAEAIVQAVRFRWFGWLAKIYYLPGLRQLIDAAYRVLARNRFRIAARECTDGSCAMHYR